MLHDLKYAWRSLTSRRGDTCCGPVPGARRGREHGAVRHGGRVAAAAAGGCGGPVVAGPAERGFVGAGGGWRGPLGHVSERTLKCATGWTAGLRWPHNAPRHLTLGAGVEAERLDAVVATSNYFSVLGVRPHAGRFFTAHDDVGGAIPVAVLSHGAWKRRFGRQRRSGSINHCARCSSPTNEAKIRSRSGPRASRSRCCCSRARQNLLLAQGVVREREIAVRLALARRAAESCGSSCSRAC
jgi:hypothetical protein